MTRANGYALFVVLSLIVFFFILTTTFSMNLQLGAREARTLEAEAEAYSLADSGIQYALESVRQGGVLSDSPDAAPWNLLSSANGTSNCFKVFLLAPCPPNTCVRSYGEMVRGDCGDYLGDTTKILAARKVDGVIDPTAGHLVKWTETVSP